MLILPPAVSPYHPAPANCHQDLEVRLIRYNKESEDATVSRLSAGLVA